MIFFESHNLSHVGNNWEISGDTWILGGLWKLFKRYYVGFMLLFVYKNPQKMGETLETYHVKQADVSNGFNPTILR